MLRGEWVEVDRERLKATLEGSTRSSAWRARRASLRAAMRLLAGAGIGGAVEAQAAEASGVG